MNWRKISIGVVLSFVVTLGFTTSSHAVDNTYCTVKSTSDSAGEFFSLRNKIERGFNLPPQDPSRFCTELIDFEGTDGQEMVITLTKALEIDGSHDGNCDHSTHPLCNGAEASISFSLDGSTHGAGVVIDTTGVNDGDDRCAIKITGFDMVYTGITIKTNQGVLVGRDESDNSVICEEGNDNDFTGLELDSETPPPPVEECGNGIIEGNEDCDNGDENGPNGRCTNECVLNPNHSDGDGIPDGEDNCPEKDNADQADCDGDDIGDVCDSDWDNDGVIDGVDNCAPDRSLCDGAGSAQEKQVAITRYANPVDAAIMDQPNQDGDAYGDHCDDDIDGDTVPNHDNGDSVPNADPNADVCDIQFTVEDNCPCVSNEDQADLDNNGWGSACDAQEEEIVDEDNDGIEDEFDNCSPSNPEHNCSGAACANPGQEDLDEDTIGDVCDDDKDGDGVNNDEDDDPEGEDQDGDGTPNWEDPCPTDPEDLCNVVPEDDTDSDGFLNENDNCPMVANAGQEDSDGDGVGDACDPDNPDGDSDADGVLNASDNCPTLTNPDQENQDGDSLGDICDPNPSTNDDETDDGGDTVAEVDGGGCSLNAKSSGDWIAWLLLLGISLAVTRVRTPTRASVK